MSKDVQGKVCSWKRGASLEALRWVLAVGKKSKVAGAERSGSRLVGDADFLPQ